MADTRNLEFGKPEFRKPARVTRVLAWIFLVTTIGLGGALAWTWIFVSRLALKPLPDPPRPDKMQVSSGPASPLQIQYQLNMPGRGEIFPALNGAQAADYWPVAVLSVANTSSKAV